MIVASISSRSPRRSPTIFFKMPPTSTYLRPAGRHCTSLVNAYFVFVHWIARRSFGVVQSAVNHGDWFIHTVGNDNGGYARGKLCPYDYRYEWIVESHDQRDIGCASTFFFGGFHVVRNTGEPHDLFGANHNLQRRGQSRGPRPAPRAAGSAPAGHPADAGSQSVPRPLSGSRRRRWAWRPTRLAAVSPLHPPPNACCTSIHFTAGSATFAPKCPASPCAAMWGRITCCARERTVYR